ncbi:uncharacterized protein LOC111391071 [Olea europaea var. sylvestris]|nr:uncharacterized protein LOC111391071 [Olea europaea var. sylvestris]
MSISINLAVDFHSIYIHFHTEESPLAMASNTSGNHSNSNQPSFDVSSPYLLHASDNPSATLVTCLLREENYPTWRGAMTNALQAKSKFGFVDGSIKRPTSGSLEESAWIKCNSMCGVFCDSARNDLEERFSQGNAPRIHQLKIEMMNTLQQGMTVSVYYTKLKGIWDELNTYSQIPPCTCDSLPSLSRTYALVAQEECQQLVTASRLPPVETAFQTGNTFRSHGSYKSTGNHDPSKRFCEYCKKARHTQDTCFELHGYPKWWDKEKKAFRTKTANSSQRVEANEGNNAIPINGLTNDQYAQLISMLNLDKEHNCTTNFAGKATSLSNGTTEWVLDSDGSFMPAKSYGDVPLNPPDLASRKLIGMGELRDGLYYFQAVKASTAVSNTTSDSRILLWHQRLGHLSFDRLSLLSDLGLSSITSFNNCCDPCHRAKQTRKPFSTSSIKTIESFELIHCDVWRPSHTTSLSGANYFLSIVDDYTRSTWIYLIKTKAEVYTRLTSFIAMIDKQFGKAIKQIHSDNRTEFTNHNFQLFCQQNGILTQFSCVATPQQNGVVERKHRHILEAARALRFQANLLIKFCGECILTAVYLINYTPTPLLSGKNKFQERASACIFIGYPHGQKGYKVYDLTSHRVFTSWDLTFYEHIFPFQEKSSSPPPDRIPPMTTPIPLPALDHETTSLTPLTTTESMHHLSDIITSDHSIDTDSAPLISNLLDTFPTDQPHTIPTQRPSRARKLPSYFRDFHVDLPENNRASPASSNNASSGTSYPLSNFHSYSNFSPPYTSFLVAITQHDEPRSYKQAIQDVHW